MRCTCAGPVHTQLRTANHSCCAGVLARPALCGAIATREQAAGCARSGRVKRHLITNFVERGGALPASGCSVHFLATCAIYSVPASFGAGGGTEAEDCPTGQVGSNQHTDGRSTLPQRRPMRASCCWPQKGRARAPCSPTTRSSHARRGRETTAPATKQLVLTLRAAPLHWSACCSAITVVTPALVAPQMSAHLDLVAHGHEASCRRWRCASRGRCRAQRGSLGDQPHRTGGTGRRGSRQ